MKSTIISKTKPPGFDAKVYAKQSVKAGKSFQRNSKVIKLHGIQDSDQRSSNEYEMRVRTGKSKPMSMTYGVKDKTLYKKGKA